MLESDLLDSIYVGGLSFNGLSKGGGEGICDGKSSGFFKLNLFFEAISSYSFSLYSLEENFWLSSIASVITRSDVGSSSSLWNLWNLLEKIDTMKNKGDLMLLQHLIVC